MTVKELFKIVNLNRVIEAFLLIDYKFCKDNRNRSLCERVDLIPDTTEIIRNFVNEINSMTIESAESQRTLFIFELSLTNYEDDGEVTHDLFYIEDEQAFSEIENNAHDNEYENLDHFEVDFLRTDELLGLKIADYSLQEFGNEICAAFILSHALKMGNSFEVRDNNVHKFNEKLNEEPQWIKSMSIEEFSEEMERLFTEGMNDEEIHYSRMKDEFYAKTNEFRRKHELVRHQENCKKLTEGIYGEYRRRRV